MARVPDGRLRNLGPFTKGMNNVAAETDLAGAELRDAVNTDIDRKGGLSRRDGYEQVVAGDCHSVFGTDAHLLMVKDNILVALDKELSEQIVRYNMSPLPVSFAQVLTDVYWSNEIEIRRLTETLEDEPVWLANPDQPTFLPLADGGLPAGTYQLAETMIGPTGMESGSTLAVQVEVPENGGIAVSAIALSEGAHHARIYMSEANGETLYARADVPVGATSGTIDASDLAGDELKTQFLYPLPPGQIVRFWNGRVLVASGDTLWYSEALRFGLCRTTNYFRFAGRITMLEVVGEGEDNAGVYVSDGRRVYFMDGADPFKWKRLVRFMHPAVENSGITVSGSLFYDEEEQPYTGPVAVWVSQNGVYCLGLPGGSVRTIREDSVALPSFSRAAMLLREQDGQRQIIGSFSGEKTNKFSVRDSMSATVRRHGVVLD